MSGERGVLTEEERLDRLNELREKYGYSDADVIRMAQDGNLPVDPDFVAWLVFLGKGDLV